MSIMFVSPGYFPKIGGVEYVVKSVADRLMKLGISVSVFAADPNVNGLVEDIVDNIRVFRWPSWEPSGAYVLPKDPRMMIKAFQNYCDSADVIHLHSVHVLFTYFAWKAWREGCNNKKLVITPHFHGSGHSIIRRILWIPWKNFVGKMLRDADVVQSVSAYECDLLNRHFNLNNCVVVEHGVEELVKEFKWDPQGYVFYSGRIEKYKNIELIGMIVKILNEKFDYGLSFRVNGEGSYVDVLRRKLDRLGIEYEINAFQPYKQYLETLSKASLVGLLSEKEAYGMTINEALSIGVPSIVAKPWGDIFADKNRVLIIDTKTDINNIAFKVNEFLNSVSKKPIDDIPTWSEVVRTYLKEVYA